MWLSRIKEPPFKLIEHKPRKNAPLPTTPRLIGFFSSAQDPEYAAFVQAAHKFYNEADVGVVVDPKLAKRDFRVRELPAIGVFPALNIGKPEFLTDLPVIWDADSIIEQAMPLLVPLFRPYTPDTVYSVFGSPQKTVVISFVDMDDRKKGEGHLSSLKDVAQRLSSMFTFAYMDVSRWNELSARYGVEPDDELPLMVALPTSPQQTSQEQFWLDQPAKPNNVRRWLEEVARGTAVASSRLPWYKEMTSEGWSTELDQDMYRSGTLRAPLAFVFFYTHDCETECKRLGEMFSMVARFVRSRGEYHDAVLFGTYDLDKNGHPIGLPFTIDALPTVVATKAAQIDKAESWTGTEATYTDMLRFMQAFSSGRALSGTPLADQLKEEEAVEEEVVEEEI